MITTRQAFTKTPVLANAPIVVGGLLQRACTCGQHTGGGNCETCKREHLQPIIHPVLQSPGSPLDPTTRAALEPRFGHDFSRVRVHTGPRAAELAQAVNALAYTVGNRIVFGAGQYRPEEPEGQRLLAHELAHVVQQSGNRESIPGALTLEPTGSSAEGEARQAARLVASGAARRLPLTPAPAALARQTPTAQAQPTPAPASRAGEPGRFGEIHQSLFVNAPGTAGGARRPWEAGSAALIISQFKAALQQLIDNRPLSVMGTVSTRTTEAAAEADAIQIDARIRARFPFIPTRLTEAEIRQAVTIIPPGQALDEDFLRQWLSNRLIQHTDLANFALTEDDPRFDQLLTNMINDQQAVDFTAALDRLAADRRAEGWTEEEINIVVAEQRNLLSGKTWPWVYRTLASRVGAFARAGQEVAFSPGISEPNRKLTLIHELVHFYAHPEYRAWVDAATSPRFYNEGFTEFLARQVMTPDELTQRSSYPDRLEAIEREVAPFVSAEDIARAFFLGEVWRLEGRTAVARRQFESQVGLPAGATRPEEVAASRSSAGFVETVQPGAHYRFLNLGVAEAEPKPEHVAEFRRIYTEFVRAHPGVRLRFAGHASSPGSADFNRRLSRRRALSFYAMARAAGVPENQLADAAAPPHAGETAPVAANEDVHGRAFNRRVELFILAAPENGREEQ